MSILTKLENKIVINTTQGSDTFEDILSYISLRIDDWVGKNVIWDVNSLDFSKVKSQSIQPFILNGQLLSEKRKDLNTAIIVESDLGFGMMRMLQLLSEGQIRFKFGVFRSKSEAMKWLGESDA